MGASMIRFSSLLTCLAPLIFAASPLLAQQPPKESTARAIASHPELGKVGSPFNVEFLRRMKIRSAEDAAFHQDKSWPEKLAAEVAREIGSYAAKPEIEFKVLLIIKRRSDTYHPLFLPVRAEMTPEDVRTARHCFEIQTPDMVHTITHGRVKFTPTVVVSDQPLRCFDPKRLDSAEYMGDELIDELATLAKPGDYDSVGYYFLHYDTASGYRAPRAGYGVGGYHGGAGLGMFAISSTSSMNPRDEIYLHEWMHGLDGYYGGKEGVRLPKGALHGAANYDAHYDEFKPWRPQDTFRGHKFWYQDILNGEVPEPGGGFSGHGSKAWKHGPMRDAGREIGSRFRTTDLPLSEYPEWVHRLMKGDLSDAPLSPESMPMPAKAGEIGAGQTPWRLESFSKAASTTARFSGSEEGVFTLECESRDKAAITCEADVAPLSNYVLTAEVKTSRVEIMQAGGKQAVVLGAGSSQSTTDLSGSVEWRQVVVPFTTHTEKKPVTLRLGIGGDGSLTQGKAQFRNVRLQKIGYPATRLIRAAAR